MSHIKGCDRYIFASLFFKFKGEHLWNKEKCFSFHFKSSFRSWDNQILNFQIFKCCDVIEFFDKTFSFQRILCKKESEEVCKLIWINFDSFPITYLATANNVILKNVNSLLQKYHFPVEIMCNSLQTQKSLRLVFRSQLL